MAHDYETSKKIATKTIIILGVITIFEVLFALAGKGYLVEGWDFPTLLMGGVMILMSAFKAYFIIYEFMHMKYEAPSLVRSVLLPCFLLVWAIIAFLYEGEYWGKANRQEKDKVEVVDIPNTKLSQEVNEESH